MGYDNKNTDIKGDGSLFDIVRYNVENSRMFRMNIFGVKFMAVALIAMALAIRFLISF